MGPPNHHPPVDESWVPIAAKETNASTAHPKRAFPLTRLSGSDICLPREWLKPKRTQSPGTERVSLLLFDSKGKGGTVDPTWCQKSFPKSEGRVEPTRV